MNDTSATCLDQTERKLSAAIAINLLNAHEILLDGQKWSSPQFGESPSGGRRPRTSRGP